MEYEMEDFQHRMEMEWKKIASMKYGKIVFHSISCPGYAHKQNLETNNSP